MVGLLLPMGMLQGCRTPDQPTPAEQPDEKPDDKPDEPPVVKSDPVRIVLTKANIANMDYTYDESSDTYTVTTTSDDPYVFSERLAADLDGAWERLDNAPYHVGVAGFAVEGAVKVDYVQLAAALRGPVPCLGRGVVSVDGHVVGPPLAQADAFAVL